MDEPIVKRLDFAVAKVDEAQELVFGWAAISANSEGETVTDLQRDIIEPAMLESAAYDFVLHSREAGVQHEEGGKGRLVESFVVHPDKLEKMGLTATEAPLGWWVGFKVDSDTFKRVKGGELRMFSIEGRARRVPVEA